MVNVCQAVEQGKKKPKGEQSSDQFLLPSKFRKAKQKASEQLAMISEGATPTTTKKKGKLVELLDTVFSPLTGKGEN